MDTAHEEWIRHRVFGVGRVIRREGRSLVAEFPDGEQVVDKMYRSVEPDSLDVLSVVDPGMLRTLIAEAPHEIALALLQATPLGLTGADVRRKLEQLGLDADDAQLWWLDAEPALRARTDIRVEGEPATFQLVGAAGASQAGPEEVEALLVRLASKRLKSDGRKKLEEELRSIASTNDLPTSLLAAAQALGVPVGPAADLNDADPRAYGAKLLAALVDRAGADTAGFLIKAVLAGRSLEAAEVAASRVRALLPPAQITLLVSHRFGDDAARLDAHPKSDIGESANRLASIVNRAHLLVSEGTPVLLGSLILLDTAAQRTHSTAREVLELRLAIGHLVDVIAITPEAVSKGIERLPEGVSDASLAHFLEVLPLKSGNARLRYLTGLASSPRRRSAFRDEAWDGLDLSSLAAIVQEPVVQAFLGTEAGRAQAQRAIVAGFTRGRRALATLLREPSLLDFVTDDVLSGLLGRLAASDAAVGRIQDRIAMPILQAAAADAAAREAAVIEEHAVRAASALRARDEQAAHADRLRDEVANLEQRLRRDASGAGEASAAQLRQARIDGLTVAAEVLAELERLTPTRSDGGDLMMRMERVATTHGLLQLDRRGDLVSFDPERHRMLAGEPASPVEVLESTWGVAIGGRVTAIRYGLVMDPTRED